jgi:DNA-binding IclR family transcriptional regulator
MAKIEIITTPEEQQQVLEALKKVSDQTVAVSAIASAAGMKQNRVRYVIADLVEAGKIKRVPTKAFNEHYIRYRYEIIEEFSTA